MEVGAGISPKLLLARLSLQSPLKFGLASAGNTASVMTAKVAKNRLDDISATPFLRCSILTSVTASPPGYYRNRRRAQNGPRRAKRQAICFASRAAAAGTMIRVLTAPSAYGCLRQLGLRGGGSC